MRDYRPQAAKSRSEKIDGARRPMRARVVEGEERERLWAMVCDHCSGYATYQRRAGDRLIPVIAVEPR
jgi:hypothetical protein